MFVQTEGKMKTRLFLNAVTMVLIAAVLSACLSSAAPASTVAVAQPDELDAGIRAASDYLNDKVPEGSKVVFLNITSDYPDLSEYLISCLSENAVNDGVFSVVDRQQLDLIRAELNFQTSGEVSDESAQGIGKMLGAQSIVSGGVSKMGSLYRVQVKAIEVQSAGVQGQWSRNIPNGTTIAALTENYAPTPATAASGSAATATPATAVTAPASSTPAGAAATPASPAPAASATTPAPAAPAASGTNYAIGQRGPAGGFVFYDNNPASVSQAAPTTRTYTVGQNGPSGGLTFYDNNPAPVSQAAPTTRAYTVGQNGPAGGLTFYDNNPTVVLAAAPMNSSATYSVGDRGPAGGIIFYVNPSATDGWRYLEAAPASTEARVAWSTNSQLNIRGTNVEIGAGKQNTQTIVTYALNNGVSCRAVTVCDNLKSGGYDDWFLPSKSELNLMFVYLHEAGIGGFKADWYWSSSLNGDRGFAWTQLFSNGSQQDAYSFGGENRGEVYVRAIRQF
jgi:hypothetical protein